MGRGLPKKYAKMGFSKGWREYKKSKTYKGRTPKRKIVGVKKVAKRRYRRKRYRRKKRKMPLEIAVALGAIPFTSAADGYASPVEAVQAGDLKGLGDNLKRGFLGIDHTGRFNLAGLLNPFDMNEGRYVKMLIAAGIISKIRKSVIRIPFDKVPLVGKYIS